DARRLEQGLRDHHDLPRARLDEQSLGVFGPVRIADAEGLARPQEGGLFRGRFARVERGLGYAMQDDAVLASPAVVADVRDVKVRGGGLFAGTDGDVLPIAGARSRELEALQEPSRPVEGEQARTTARVVVGPKHPWVPAARREPRGFGDLRHE